MEEYETVAAGLHERPQRYTEEVVAICREARRRRKIPNSTTTFPARLPWSHAPCGSTRAAASVEICYQAVCYTLLMKRTNVTDARRRPPMLLGSTNVSRPSGAAGTA
jgi:hypothetical protein